MADRRDDIEEVREVRANFSPMAMLTIVASVLAIIGSLFAGWFYMERKFASQEDLVAFKQEQIIEGWTTESTFNTMRLDILEERVLREEKSDDPSLDSIARMNRTISKLEARNEVIVQNQENLKIKSVIGPGG